MPKVKGKDLGRKIKILWVNEASFLRTGFSTYGWQVMKRLQATGKYEIVELASYAQQSDPRWKDPKWNITWKYYGAMPENNDELGKQQYQQNYHFGQFGAVKFDEVILREKPDIVIDIRDRWMASEWQLRSPLRKFFTYMYMPCVDSHPPMPDWVQDYSNTDYILGYSWYAKRILEREGVKCWAIANPGVDAETFNTNKSRTDALERFNLRSDIKPILCVHRNQKRKLLPDVVYSYLILKNEYPEAFKNSVLWFHTSWPDVGFNIPVVMDRAKMGRIPYKDAKGRIKEKSFKQGLKYSDVVFSYICHSCGHAFVSPYVNGSVVVRDNITGETKSDNLKCDLIYCQKCGKKSARMPNTQVGFNPEDLADVFRSAYVFVQASIAGAAEMPMVEAKACGTPVLGSVHAAMHEQVEKTDYCDDERHKGGMPIEVESIFTEAETMQHRCLIDKEHLAKQLNKILLDKNLRDKLSLEASEVAKKYYNWDDIAKIWDDLLTNEVTIKTGEDSWNMPARIKEVAQIKIPNQNELSNEDFVKWCYKTFLDISIPDAEGFGNWMRDLSNGRTRENVVGFFKGQVEKRNNLERIRTGQTPLDNQQAKLTDYMDSKDTFRVLVVMPGTAGDLHLLTGTLKSIYDKYASKTKNFGLYVACESTYKDIFKNLPFIKNVLPYAQNLDNAKAIEQSGIVNVAFTPHIITQRFEHYAHRGHGKHLARAYADMCDVDLSPPTIFQEPIDGLPQKFYALHCKTSMKSKDWPMEYFKSLVSLFPNETFVQIGGSKDEVIEAPNVISFVGKTNFNQLAYIIKKAEGIVGLDSIALHIASSVGTKVVGIFSETWPQICGPINLHGGKIVMPVNRPPQCPEPQHVVKCPAGQNACIKHISVIDVAKAMEEVF